MIRSVGYTRLTTRIGFVGLGHMGGNMAARFLAAGYAVDGEQRNREHARGLVDAELQWRETPREVAESADIVFTSLPDDGALTTVASGPDGILAGLTAGKIWVETSTVSPRASRELAERVHAIRASMLDAPVSGSVPQVQAGTLTIIVGGDEHAYSRVEPILREFGTPAHIGENGQGLVLKLAINISLAVQMLAFSEGLLLAKTAGIDHKLAVDVMTQRAISSPMLKARAPTRVTRRAMTVRLTACKQPARPRARTTKPATIRPETARLKRTRPKTTRAKTTRAKRARPATTRPATEVATTRRATGAGD